MFVKLSKALKLKNKKVNEYNNLVSKMVNHNSYDVDTKQGNYATYTIDEFFVALFTNPKFIKELEGIPPLNKKYKNFLEEIFNGILKILGINKNQTFYEEVFSLSTNILQEAKDLTDSLFEINQMFQADVYGDIVELATPSFNTSGSEIKISKKEMEEELGVTLYSSSVSDTTIKKIDRAIRGYNNKNSDVHYQAIEILRDELPEKEQVGKSPLYRKIIVKKFDVGSKAAEQRRQQKVQINVSDKLIEDYNKKKELEKQTVIEANKKRDNNTGEQLTLFSRFNDLEGIIASEKTIRDLTARIADRIGINYVIESDRTKEYKGKLENNIAYINLAYATLDTPIHEILGHPIIRAIKNRSQNQEDSSFNKLYENLLEELSITQRGKEV
jgi:hypothetical protein